MAGTSRDPFQLQGRYADRNRFEVINGPGDGRVTGQEIVQDENLVDAMPDKVMLITGVSSGMGVETVRALALTGATIYGCARNVKKAEEALGKELLATGRVNLLYMDQTDLQSVRNCAEEFKKKSKVLHVMVNNAAVMNTPESKTIDGFELQFATNHLSHFLLFYLLKYNGWLSYGSSKTANIYMANHIDRLYGDHGVHGYSVHPGAFWSSNLQKFSQEEMKAMDASERTRLYICNLEQACATSVYGAISNELEGKGPCYLEGASMSVEQCPPDGDAVEYGYAAWAFDQRKEEELWALSKKLCQVE